MLCKYTLDSSTSSRMVQRYRIYVVENIHNGMIFSLKNDDVHYLKNVVRIRKGDSLSIFNERDGEWNSEILDINKKSIEIIPTTQIRKSETQQHGPNLYFAPVKNKNSNIIRQATELGVSSINPIITERTIVREMNMQRMYLQIKEASEQCTRINIPKIREIINFSKIPQKNTFLCDTTSNNSDSLSNTKKSDVNIVIGPEGGFTQRELDSFTGKRISLGNTILRVDTAVIAAITLANFLCKE